MNDTLTPVPGPAPSLLAGYQPRGGVFDECFDANCSARPHWRPFLAELESLGRPELLRRWEQARRQIANDGITFNPYDTAGEVSRPWSFDALPILLHETEWEGVSAALQQRAHLLDLILQDLFGPQQLLRERVLPPDVLFGNPGFYPAYHGLTPPNRRHLFLYAADLARAPDGQWWVAGDRTRAPFGLGYVLENRIVTSRMLPAVMRNCQVQRLASFFIALKECLRDLAPRARENPRIVLWSKGPQSRSYFEDAYLARYLGYTLVEGGDLAVRGNRVMLKTLGGLLPVEVILRRLDDDDCDSVELNPDSSSGVAGLLEVMRAGEVAVANPPGSRLVEAPLLQAFLPGACRFLLGEDLGLPSVATWWCGQPESRKYVLEHLDDLMIRRAFRVEQELPIYPARLSAKERAQLIANIEAQPARFVGQETVVRSTTPVLADAGPTPWHIALRSFMVCRDDGCTMLPGALARVSPDAAVLDLTMTTGERSQDVWIISDRPIPHVSLLPEPGERVEPRRSGSELPSRVADNQFWLGRYVERAEGLVRLLSTVMTAISGEEQEPRTLERLYRALAEQGQIDPDYVISGLNQPLPDISEVLPEAVFDEQMSRSLRSTIAHVMRLISTVRDRVSVDAWRVIHRVDEASRHPQNLKVLDPSDVLEILDGVLTDLLAFAGLASESMTRTQGWRFLDLGRRLERAWQTALLVNSTLTHALDDERPLLEAILETVDSVMTYRSRYLATMQIAPVLDLLIVDETNPRSIGYQLRVIEDHVSELPRDEVLAGLRPEQRTAVSLRNAVRLADVFDLARADDEGHRPVLDRLLRRLTDQLPRLSDAISSRFLTYAGLPRHYGTNGGTDH
jgi:uncharacterized circularly permuted ATP-grasp superfamily protein/uncharacterized alpha-E superfamily protein